MKKYVTEVKSIIRSATDVLSKRKLPNIELRCSFIGYRDFKNLEGKRTDDQIIVFNFTKNVDDFDRFINIIEFNGGWDEPKDVFGG